MGHLNGTLARVGGNLNNNFQKSQIPGGGGMLKLRFDRYIKPDEGYNLLGAFESVLCRSNHFVFSKRLFLKGI